MLQNIIKEDLIKFMKEKNKSAIITIRTLNSEILKKEKDCKTQLLDEEIISIISKSISQYKETLSYAKKINDQNSIKECNISISILEVYLPKQLTKEEVKEIISKAIFNLKIESKKDMGKLMKEIIPQLNGKFDKKKINSLIQELLN